MQVGGVEFITSAATRRERRWRGSHAPCDSHYKGKVHTYDTTAPFLAVAKKDKATQRADAAARKCSVAPLNGYSAVTQCPSAAGLMSCIVRNNTGRLTRPTVAEEEHMLDRHASCTLLARRRCPIVGAGGSPMLSGCLALTRPAALRHRATNNFGAAACCCVHDRSSLRGLLGIDSRGTWHCPREAVSRRFAYKCRLGLSPGPLLDGASKTQYQCWTCAAGGCSVAARDERRACQKSNSGKAKAASSTNDHGGIEQLHDDASLHSESRQLMLTDCTGERPPAAGVRTR